ncbi:ATPase [Devosia pacifica]|uniref:ATPase n=1 Tax=Devosia pacifica TaxID=1335967 RepID=A0A918SBG8_9HYPH|nr:BadF/BadG/BcrA/BcrD ATPase family protein [Devosia pacifica]GHA33185.1 ATPase [Devosia pacifica]
MKTVLGIDAGGSKTLAALADKTGAVLELYVGPGFDPTRHDDPAARLRELFSQFTPQERPEATTAGLPYYGEVARITTLEDRVTEDVFGPSARACNDVEAAHIGAFSGGEGVLCLAGTGSMAWALGPSGTSRAGGFGDLIGDEGSAYWIGQHALSLLSHEADGRRPSSSFGESLFASLGITPAELLEWIYSHDNPRAGIATVARHVSEHAAAGESEAREILSSAGGKLADVARAAATIAGLPAGAALACAGSVFADPIVRTEIGRKFGATPTACELPPVGGAVFDAARRAGWTVDATWISALRDNLHKRGHA